MNEHDILNQARERYSLAAEYEHENHDAAKESILFKTGEQWSEHVVRERRNDKRPMLTVNKISQFVNHVVNSQRQTRPGIKVRPADSGTQEVSEIYEGLIRHIENVSRSEWIYDDAFEQSVDGGFGYWRVITEYDDPMSFNQCIRIRRIRNRFSVVLDPHAVDFVKRDARYAFIHENMRKEEFEARYPDAMEGFPGDISGNLSGWYSKNSVRVAEYFTKETRKIRIALFSDGQVVQVPDQVEGKAIKEKDFIRKYEENTGAQFVKARTSKQDKVVWRKITGTKVLEGPTELPTKYIPIVPVYGSVTNVDGKDVVRGLIFPMMDSQRMYNYWITHATEMVALAPKAPFLATAKQISPHQAMWKNANVKNQPYLLYMPDPDAGSAMPKREEYPGNPTGIINMAMLASSELNETSALHPPVLGKKSNETSGVAIAQRQQQGDIATFHYTDNLARSIAFTGEILVDMIPRVYDTARVVQILGEDGQSKSIQINKMFQDEETGEERTLDVRKGRYDVFVEAGPSYATKRMETANFMLEAFKIAPQLMGIAGDILFQNIDMAGAEELVRRMKKALPPEFRDEGQQAVAGAPQAVQFGQTPGVVNG